MPGTPKITAIAAVLLTALVLMFGAGGSQAKDGQCIVSAECAQQDIGLAQDADTNSDGDIGLAQDADISSDGDIGLTQDADTSSDGDIGLA